MSASRNASLTTGASVPLDGDLLAIIECLYREVTLRNALNPSFETMRREILLLIDQMSDAERRAYLFESLFLNTVTYENEKLAAYVKNLSALPVRPRKPARVRAKTGQPSRVAVRKAAPGKKKSPRRERAQRP